MQKEKQQKQAEQKRQATRQLIGVEGITEYSLKTASSEIVFFSVKPSNISVLSEENLAAKIATHAPVRDKFPSTEDEYSFASCFLILNIKNLLNLI